jgi:hypothetical protein
VDVLTFIEKWKKSGASERANKDSFIHDFCDVLGVPHPDPKTGDPDRDRYVFEREAVLVHGGERHTLGFIDLYKHGCLILEAKQGSDVESKKIGTARRDTPSWAMAMQEAFGQAFRYTEALEPPPPFLIVTDIGYCFDIYAAFDGSRNYRKFPDALTSRIALDNLNKPEVIETLRAIFLDPQSLDPSKRATKVTREIAGHVAALARSLEAAGHDPETVAKFLMRCLFTMFAEDVDLLPKGLFADALENRWLEHPEVFPSELEDLWRRMNEGGYLFGAGRIWQFNGGLFADPTALPLEKDQLWILAFAAKQDWSDVEPAIFGTLLERALDPKERNRLGAHYTPRAYVERLVRPTIEEPLRAEWDNVRAQVLALVSAEDPDKNIKAVAEARRIVYAFYDRLTRIRVLDPACGSGNFLYVALDLFKRIENEVIDLLDNLGDDRVRVAFARTFAGTMVTPAQFLGIEIKPWAKEITELILWIGWLQWQIRTRGWKSDPQEPILRDYHNIQCRDAVLAYDAKEPRLDDDGQPVTRWDGETMKTNPATGEPVPDETARVPVYKYVNPRKAEWPEAEYVVGNPPFVGNKKMRRALGSDYVDGLRAAHDDVPNSADFVMLWWNHAAALLKQGAIRRFGLITTNSVTQKFNRRVIAHALETDPVVSLAFAIPDHPWIDSADGAAVRIAMTVATRGIVDGVLAECVAEEPVDESDGGMLIELVFETGRIHADLRVGPNVAGAVPLTANKGLCGQGIKLVGDFRTPCGPSPVSPTTGHGVVRPMITASNIIDRTEADCVIDFFALEERTAKELYPVAYQQLLVNVKPDRNVNARDSIRELWWRFGWERPVLRAATAKLHRYFLTLETAKFRFFVAAPTEALWDGSLFAVALEDWFHFGLLSSRVHTVWSLTAAGTLEDRSRYNNTLCFDPFPFPSADEPLKQRIRHLGEQLDAHRKRQQALRPDLTITGMYNVLEKLRSAEALTSKEKKIHEDGLVSVLMQIHDELDAAVLDAYGWPHDLTDDQILERLVELNAERAEEEKRGLIRWLRPDFQNPSGIVAPTQATMQIAVASGEEERPQEILVWPDELPKQIAAVRDFIAGNGGADRIWSVDSTAQSFRKAKKKQVESVLDSLAALGLLISFETTSGKRWRSAS